MRSPWKTKDPGYRKIAPPFQTDLPPGGSLTCWLEDDGKRYGLDVNIRSATGGAQRVASVQGPTT